MLTVSTGIALAAFGVPIVIGTLNIDPAITRIDTIFPATASNLLQASRSWCSNCNEDKKRTLFPFVKGEGAICHAAVNYENAGNIHRHQHECLKLRQRGGGRVHHRQHGT